MTPTEEQVQAAREWLGRGHSEAIKRNFREEFTENLAALLATREAALQALLDITSLSSKDCGKELEEMREESECAHTLAVRQGDLLTRTVNVLRGQPPDLTSWSHHDAPERAAEMVAEVAWQKAANAGWQKGEAKLVAERDAALAQVAMLREATIGGHLGGGHVWTNGTLTSIDGSCNLCRALAAADATAWLAEREAKVREQCIKAAGKAFDAVRWWTP